MTVTVYSTTTCPFCVMVKDWLKEQNVESEIKAKGDCVGDRTRNKCL